MNQRLKDFIFEKLNEDLSKVEIIPYKDSIWFIDREKRYWYFEYEKSGTLWWRWDFFPRFFYLFSMERNEFEPLLLEWVEEVLNCKVETLLWQKFNPRVKVEEALNCKVDSCKSSVIPLPVLAEQALNYKVDLSCQKRSKRISELGEVLEHKVESILPASGIPKGLMDRIKKYYERKK